MAAMCGATENDGVLEIGPGAGVLTLELSDVAKKVAAVELDARLLPVLAETLNGCLNVSVINGDILKLDLDALLSEQFAGCERVFVAANLPYYITTPVITRLLSQSGKITAMTLMVQREVADRLCAPVGSRASGAVTVLAHYKSVPELLFDVPRSCFTPSPRVDSAVIRLTLRERPEFFVGDEEFFFKMVTAAFSQRRKTASNSISSGLNIDKGLVEKSLETVGVPGSIRAEKLSMEELAALSRELLKII